MRLNVKYHYGQHNPLVSIADAVEGTLDGFDYDRGQIETLGASQNSTAEMLGRLIQKLHENHVLSDDDVLSFVTGYKKAED